MLLDRLNTEEWKVADLRRKPLAATGSEGSPKGGVAFYLMYMLAQHDFEKNSNQSWHGKKDDSGRNVWSPENSLLKFVAAEAFFCCCCARIGTVERGMPQLTVMLRQRVVVCNCVADVCISRTRQHGWDSVRADTPEPALSTFSVPPREPRFPSGRAKAERAEG